MAASDFQQVALTKGYDDVSYPEVVDVIAETLRGVFAKGVCSSTLSRPRQLWGRTKDYFLTLHAWGTTRSKYGCTQMDFPQGFEPLQARRWKKPAHCCVDVCGGSVVKVQQGQVDKASPEKMVGPSQAQTS